MPSGSRVQDLGRGFIPAWRFMIRGNNGLSLQIVVSLAAQNFVLMTITLEGTRLN